MKVNRETYITGATKWIGTREGDSRHKEIVANYNRARPLPRGYSLKVTDAWCAGFMTAVAVEVGCSDVFPCECSCWYMEKKAGEMGYIIDRDNADVGDFILYDWEQDGTSDHVGCVVQRNGSTLKVIEGNKSDAVGYREIGIKSKNIRTVFRIPWADNGTGVKNNEECNGCCPVHCKGKKSVDDVAKEVIRGLWGNGSDRKKRVIEAGYDYSAVQKRVNELLRG